MSGTTRTSKTNFWLSKIQILWKILLGIVTKKLEPNSRSWGELNCMGFKKVSMSCFSISFRRLCSTLDPYFPQNVFYIDVNSEPATNFNNINLV